MGDFVHLHVHTEYSLLDGVNRTQTLLSKVSELNMNSVAVTDHGVLYGVPEFWTNAKDAGVKPIIGCEIYLSPGDMTVRKDVDGIRYYHLLLLAKNLVGYKNLVKLVSKGHLEGMYYKPRIDFETLKKHSEGLICTSACLAGPLSRHIVRDELHKAEDWLKKLHDAFGDDFYLEIQRNGIRCEDEIDYDLINSFPEQERADHLEMVTQQVKVNKKLYEYSDRFKIPVIATTDAHYLDPEDKDVQKILFCIKDGRTIDDPSVMNGYLETYIKTPEELARDFSDIPHVLEETLKIDEKIEEFDITFDRVQPKFWNLPKEKTAEEELKYQTYVGAYEKYPHEHKQEKKDISKLKTEEIKALLSDKLVERIDYELKVIHDKGYDDYFLVVSDIMKWAAKQDILTGVRGSVAGAVVAHCLDIVEVEPIQWELYFERFLNPERPSPPDIDMDIQDSRRDELIDYVRDKYGQEAVAAICAIGRLKTKAAIRDVARVMDIDLKVADKLSKMVTVLFGKPFTFEKMMDTDPEFKRIVDSDPKLGELGIIVTKIEGLSRHMSVHACGYLVTPGPIVDYTALQKESGSGDRVITQWEGPWIEDLGLMKFDFLGLRTLTIIADTLALIEKKIGKRIEFKEIVEGDEETYKLFGRGETVGVFQFESPPMQRYLIDLQPTSQEDLCFMAAAYRPGPMKYIPDYISCKHGKKEPEFLVPELKDIVGYTYGFAIYQEQVIRISVDLGGYSMGGADLLRRAMGKKKMKIMKQEEPKFKKGVMDKGYDQNIADKLWEYMLPFADYGFNKAHAAGYAVLAYKCGYLKAHYPLEFMSALLHADLENPDRIVIDMKEAKRMGFELLPPDINKSDVYFAPEDGKGIRYGLGAIKNVGVRLCELIIEERGANGVFRHFDDFVNRVGTKNMNKRNVEYLIKAGAFDLFGERNALIEIIPHVFEKAEQKRKAEELGQTALFAMTSEHDGVNSIDKTNLPEVTPMPDRERMRYEKELLGMYVSDHPLQEFAWTHILPRHYSTEEIEELPNQMKIKIVGMLGNIKYTQTKADGKRMAIVAIEDLHGSADSVIFPRTFEELEKKELIAEGRPFLIEGTVNIRDDRRSIIIDSIEPANVLIKPKSFAIDIRGVSDEIELKKISVQLLKEGEDALEILYGPKKEERKIVKQVDLSDEVLTSVLKGYAVV